MALISPAQAADNVTSVNAASINTPINTIANDYNGNITDANIATGAAIGAQKLAGGVAGMFGAWTSYTPTFANTTLGNGTVTGKYIQIGKTVKGWASFVMGSTSAVSTAPTASLPVTSVSYNTSLPVGITNVLDSGNANYPGLALWASTTTLLLGTALASGTYTTFQSYTSSIPVTFGSADGLFVSYEYEAA